MNGSQSTGSGFPPHLQEQLHEIALSVPNPQTGRGRGQNRRARGNVYQNNQQFPQHHNGQHTYGQPPSRQPHPAWGGSLMVNATDDRNAFPPLGASRPIAPPRGGQQNQNIPTVQPSFQTQYSQPPGFGHAASTASNSSYDSRRGAHNRGRAGPNRGRGNPHYQHNQQGYVYGQGQSQNPDDFRRPAPAPAQRNLYTVGQPQFNNLEEQRAFKKKILDQSDFMNHLASQALKNQLTPEEQQQKEQFRKVLETIAQETITKLKTKEMTFDPKHVQLKLYGSLGSGFGVAGSDMDLLLAFPQNEGALGDIEIESRRLLEKALLNAGIGARLLENTRVPILRVCEKPNPELLKNLREYRLKWEQSPEENAPPPVDEGFGPLPVLSNAQDIAATAALADLDLEAHEVPLPTSPQPEHAKIEFTDDCGIQCDINFSNYVALHNTRLLRTYGMCDPRVRQVGVFVKLWAKARDINTPYRGTLSSYGYILMVLHYLMHVVNPPVLPNLQDLAKAKDSWNTQPNVELVEGFDVRFIQNMEEVRALIAERPRNHESVGSLLRGFFWYFADPRGFHWNYDVISIRSRSGRMTKKFKGWTEAKWSATNQNVRLRYLLAIEDPFEIEHNIARTVGHSGIVAIRDEFRKAWEVIENINFNQEDGLWFFKSKEGNVMRGDSMMTVVENRGDLLHKDQDYRRKKARQMRQNLEAKEKALREAIAHENESQEEVEMNGTSEIQSQSVAQGLISSPSVPALINDDGFQIKNNQQETWNSSAIQTHSQDQGGWNNDEAPRAKIGDIDWSQPFTDAEVPSKVEWDNHGDHEDVHLKDDVWSPQQATMVENDYESRTSVEQEDQITPTQQEGEEDLQVVIPWTNSCQAGRWLLWRDKKILAGKWTEQQKAKQSGNQRRLDQEFPYEPNMSITDLAKKNKLLLTQYSNGFVPNIPSKASDSGIKQVPPSHDTPVVWATSWSQEQHPPPDSSTWTDPQPKSSRYKQSNRRLPTASNASTISTKNQAQTPRYQKRTRVVKDDDDDSVESQDDERAPNSTQNPSTNEHWSATESHKDLKVHNTTNDDTTWYAPAPAPKYNHVSAPTTAHIEDHNERASQPPSPVTKKTPSKDDKTALLRLFRKETEPGIQQDQEPKATSSAATTTMFQIDPRQLADLEVIREGGNGCARSRMGFDGE